MNFQLKVESKMESYHLKCFLDSLTHFLVNLTPELSHDSHINVSHKNFVRLHFVTFRFWGFMIPKISLTIKKRKQDRQHKTIYLIYQSNGTFRKWIKSVSCSQWIQTHLQNSIYILSLKKCPITWLKKLKN